MDAPFIGIDFGTSKSSIAWYDPRIRRAEIIPNAEGKLVTPSIVYLGPIESEILVGDPAERKLGQEQVEQRRFVLSVKRDLLRAATKILDGKAYSPVKVASLILKKLRTDAERHFKQPVEWAVITYPASFDTPQQDKIKEAGFLAGFKQVELMREPDAAALAYAHTGLKVGKYIMVYDFGGGTFDVAVIEWVSDTTFRRAVASRGLPRIGGDELDRAVYLYCEEIVKQQMKPRSGISMTDELDLKFLRLCRECKENLTYQIDYTFSRYLPSQNGPTLFQHTLNRSTFEGQVRTFIDQTVTLTQEVLQEANTKGYKVETVVLIGGSSRVPLVLHSLSKALPVKPVEWPHQDTAVALGAAYRAQQLWGTKPPTEEFPPKVSDPELITGPLRQTKEAPVFSPTQEYLHAVTNAWATKNLTQSTANELTLQANALRLTSDQAASFEREVMGATKEEILERQRRQQAVENYRIELNQWQSNELTQTKVDALAAKARSLGLSSNEASTTESSVFGMTKEERLKQLAKPTIGETSPSNTGTTPTSKTEASNTKISTETKTNGPTPVPTTPKRWKFTGGKFFALCVVVGMGFAIYSNPSYSVAWIVIGIFALIAFFSKNS